MFDSLIFVIFVMIAVFGVVFVFCSWIFRMIIKGNALKGIDTNQANQLIKTQPLRKRLFMTYIGKFNTTGQQRLGLARWFLICHYIHVLSYVVFVTISLGEVFHYILFDQTLLSADVSIVGKFTYNNLLSVSLYILVGALPASLIVACPVLLRSKEKIEKPSESENVLLSNLSSSKEKVELESENISTSKFKRAFKYFFLVMFPQKIEMRLRNRIIAIVVYVFIVIVILLIVFFNT